jgi:hypothetical protein
VLESTNAMWENVKTGIIVLWRGIKPLEWGV